MTDRADEVILKLSDSFSDEHKAEADIEVMVRMLNVNHDRNKELMQKCKPLAEYAWFIAEIRSNQKQYDIKKSVKKAINVMPSGSLIKEFLVTHYKEVEGMLDKEYNEAEVHELFKKEGREEGREETLVTLICKKLVKGKTVSAIADEVEESEDYVSKICDIAGKYLPNYDVQKIMEEL